MELRETVISYLWVLFGTYLTAVDGSKEEIQRHLDMGKQFLSKGQFADALSQYHAAVDADPENYQVLYQRATVFLAMGKSKSALPDLDRVVELKPDFTSARLRRADVLFKQGNLDGAAGDYEVVLKVDPSNAVATEKMQTIGPLREYSSEGIRMLAEGDIASAEQLLSKAIDLCPWDVSLRQARAECYRHLGQPGQAVADIRATTKLLQDSTAAYNQLSMLYYEMGDAEESLNQIRECLKQDPDHKQCFAHYKKVKKLHKQLTEMEAANQKEDWMGCLERYQAAIKTEPKEPGIRLVADVVACRCNAKAGHSREAITLCTAVLESDPNNLNVLCDRADAHILEEEFDDAIADFQAAQKIEENSRRAQEGINRCQKLKKQAARKDYYKILGIKRNANDREITKAYRKLAKEWHPDQFNDEAEKEKATKKFMDIASAKEVLSDPEKRQKFDNGEDPLDPEQQAGGGGGHPFGHGFNPFGGGGGGGQYSFKFHF